MKQFGYIRIKDNELRFEYYSLRKPREINFILTLKRNGLEEERFDEQSWEEAIEEYKDSKRLVEIKNISFYE